MKFDAIVMAYKRARHFTGSNGQPKHRVSTIARHIRAEGAGIAALNYSWLLGHEDGDALADLCILNMWAESINRYCDRFRVSSDLNAKLAMLAFLSALWINPIRLTDT